MLLGLSATSFVVAVISPAAAGLARIAAVAFPLPLTAGLTGHARAFAFELISSFYHVNVHYGRCMCRDIKVDGAGQKSQWRILRKLRIAQTCISFFSLPFSIIFALKGGSDRIVRVCVGRH